MGGMRRRDLVTIQLKRPVIATRHILLDNMAGSHFMARRFPLITGIELIFRLATKTVFSVLERKETVERFFVGIPPERYEEFMTALTRAIEDSRSGMLPTQQTL
jgi:hypothetical protein